MSSNPQKISQPQSQSTPLVKPLQVTPKTDSTSIQECKIEESTSLVKTDEVDTLNELIPQIENVPKKTSLPVDNLNNRILNQLNVKNENSLQVTQRKTNKTRFTKGTWKPDEDKQLISFVSSFGPQNWTRIAEFIPNRSGKQCRERWHNHLNPNINKQKWSFEEDRILIEAHKK